MKRCSLFAIFVGLFFKNFIFPKQDRIFSFLKNVKEKKEDRLFKVNFSGYVKLDNFFDTRQIVGKKAGIFFQLPANEFFDETNTDSNDQPQFNQSATESRIRVDINGPKAGNADSSVVLETDFIVGSGSLPDSTIGAAQLRHAYMNFDWEQTTIMLGHTVHPLSPGILIPNRISNNYEGIYAPRAYAPQARLYRSSELFDILFAISSHYKDQASKQAIIPNFYFQFNRKFGYDSVIGTGIDFRMEKPRLITSNNYTSSKSINSLVSHCFSVFQMGYSKIKLRLIYAENASLYDMLGGFAVINVDQTTEEREYVNLRSLNMTTELIRDTEKYEIGLFVGFSKNIGAKLSRLESIILDQEEIAPTGLGTLFHTATQTVTGIDSVITFSPRMRWKFDPAVFGVEIDYTRVKYGTMNNKGKVESTKMVDNCRVQFAAYYYF